MTTGVHFQALYILTKNTIAEYLNAPIGKRKVSAWDYWERLASIGYQHLFIFFPNILPFQ